MLPLVRLASVALLAVSLASCQPATTPPPSDLSSASLSAPSASPSARVSTQEQDKAALDAAAQRAFEAAKSRDGVVGIAVIDRKSGLMRRNKDALTRVRSASIVKVAIAAYYLQPRGPRTSAANLRALITRSDDVLAYELYDPFGPEIIADLAKFDTSVQYSRWWGHTGVTARGQARYLAALADGDVLPGKGTRTLLGLLRDVVPDQRWGLAEAVASPASEVVPVKNGWFPWSDLGVSSVNCLALLPFRGDSERLAVAVTTSFDSSRPLAYGERTCAMVGRALVG